MATSEKLSQILEDSSARADEIYCLNWIDLDSAPDIIIDDLMEEFGREELESIFEIELPEDDYEEMDTSEILEYIVSDLGKRGFIAKVSLKIFCRQGTLLVHYGAERVEWVYCEEIEKLTEKIEHRVLRVRNNLEAKLKQKV